jgi:Mce-associated membrane protein
VSEPLAPADELRGEGRDDPAPAGADVPPAELPAPAGPQHGRALVVIAAMLFVATIAAAVLAATYYNRYHSQAADRRQVEEVSGRFSTALLTYDYRSLDKAKAQVLRLATGNFRKDYEANFGALRTLLESSKSRSTSTVKEIYVAPIEHDATSAFIVLDLTVDGTAGRNRKLSEYVKLDLVKVQSGWRVDGVTNLNLGQQAATTPATAPVTAPAPTTTSSTAPK